MRTTKTTQMVLQGRFTREVVTMTCNNCDKQKTIRCPIRGIMTAGDWAMNQVETVGHCCVWIEAVDEAA
jgi:hypothetical protein